MKRLAQSLLALLAVMAVPTAATAYCGAASATAQASCESGVRVYRVQHNALPSLSPAQSAALDLQRERIALQREQLAARQSMARRKLALEEQRVFNQTYLYQDVNSPLRQRAYRHHGGFVTPFGIGQTSRNGLIVVPAR